MDSWFTPVARTVLQLMQPMALVWLGLLVLVVALWRGRQRGAACGAAALWLFVQVIGGTKFSLLLLGGLERPYAGGRLEDLPVGDAIVLLGGGVEPSPHEVGGLHFNNAGDRVIMALELARLGKARALCAGGGTAKIGSKRWIEGDMIKQAIEERQLAGIPVFSLGPCLDTHDEAVRVRRLADEHGWRRFLLVTSAWHQRRALATFRHEGLDVVPAPCNFLTGMSPAAGPPVFGLPSPLGFTLFSTWLHEQIGWLEYRRRGWISAP